MLACDEVHALPASDAQVRFATRVIDDFAARIGERAFFRVRDVARRVAGIGSLGVARYVVLVEGKGSPDGNYLLDLKQGLGRRSIKILLQEMARILAWDQLRSAGRHGSASVDEWIAFVRGRRTWRRALLEQARRCARQVVDDWNVYAAAYDKGAFGQPSAGMKALTRR